MARDHRKLRVFHEAHALTLAIYRETIDFPRDEWYGIRAQMRRGAVSVASNIVEGSARRSTPDYLNFLNIARASAAEVGYLVTLACDLKYLAAGPGAMLHRKTENLIPQLQALIYRMELELEIDREGKAPKPKA